MHRQRLLATDTETAPFSGTADRLRSRAYLACPFPASPGLPRRDARLISGVLGDAGYDVFDPLALVGRVGNRELLEDSRDAMRGAACLVAELTRPSHWVGMALAWAADDHVPTLALAPGDLDLADLTLAGLRAAGAVLVRYPEGVLPHQAARAGLPSLMGSGHVDVLA